MYLLRQFIVLESSASHPHTMQRSGEDITRTGVDLLQVSLHLEGALDGRCGGRPYHPRPGDISFVDYGQPFNFDAAPFRMLAVLIPRSAMPADFAHRSLHGFTSSATEAGTRLLAQFMQQTYAAMPKLTLAEGIGAARAMLCMASGLSQGLNRTREDMKPADLDLFSRAQALIESKLGDETLSVATLLGPLRTSRGALYSGFASYGGVSAYIRERRLQRCYEIIKIGGRSNETIGTIAFSLGFRSEAHFSRAFKDRFGLTPRSLRLAARSHGANVAPSMATGVPPEAIQSLGR